MAAPSRRAGFTLEDHLLERGYEFDFFQAVRMLALIRRSRDPVGLSNLASEIVRFHSHVSLSFPASSIHDMEMEDGDRELIHMTVAFLGLTGPEGVLPSHYTEWLLAEESGVKLPLADFFDLFNHRFVSHFYRAWEKPRFFVSYEREPAGSVRLNSITHYLFDLIGMGTGGLWKRLEAPDQALLLYAGLIAQRPHSASALAGMLQDYYQVPVEIEQMQGRWFRLEEEHLSYLDEEGLHNQLGLGAIAGDEIWNQQARFTVRLGPLEFSRYLNFLPDGAAYAELIDLTRYFVGPTQDFDVQLVLKAEEVPACRLSEEGIGLPRLGWYSWLKTDQEQFREDAGDARFPGFSKPEEKVAS